MKPYKSLLTATAILSLASATHAQVFDTGSNGALGALDVTVDTTIDLPPDGKLHYTTVSVAAGARVRFNRNARNTPVYLLARGDVTIAGTIDVNGLRAPTDAPVGGLPGPGGFPGGMPGFTAGLPPGDGYGPGGGTAGESTCAGGAAGGSYGSQSSEPGVGAVYGSPLLIPLMGGSGGGGGSSPPGNSGQPGTGGGGGGGAILIASNTRILVTGVVEALGGPSLGCINGGSGGGIRLLAPTVEGTGRIDVNKQGNGGGFGRIRVDAINRHNLRFVFSNLGATASVGNNMFVFPRDVRTLDIVGILPQGGDAGTPIPEGSGPVHVTLPFGSPPERTIRLKKFGFGNLNDSVPIAIVLTPESGPRVVINTDFIGFPGAGYGDFTVTFQPNVLTTVHVWTR